MDKKIRPGKRRTIFAIATNGPGNGARPEWNFDRSIMVVFSDSFIGMCSKDQAKGHVD